MGVDWYSCKRCGETFPDCGVYFHCDCGAPFCSYECGEHESEPDNEDASTCLYCRKEKFTDKELLQFLLKHHNLSYEDAVKLYRESNDEKE